MKNLKIAYREYAKARDDYMGNAHRLSKPLRMVLFRAYQGSKERLMIELDRFMGDKHSQEACGRPPEVQNGKNVRTSVQKAAESRA